MKTGGSGFWFTDETCGSH